MSKLTKDFGTIFIDFQAYSEEGMQTSEFTKRIFEKSRISLKGLIPIHSHDGGPRNCPFTECYTLQNDGKNHDVRLVTIPNGQWENMSTEELKNLLARQAPMVPGVPYNCSKGFAHAMVNVAGWLESEDNLPIIKSEKYYIDTHTDR